MTRHSSLRVRRDAREGCELLVASNGEGATFVTDAAAPARMSAYLELTKPRQTGLLAVTGAGAYLLTRSPHAAPVRFLVGMAALVMAVAGCTALNMVLDRDIDARMDRTQGRPIPSGRLSAREATVFGAVLTVLGLALAWALDRPFGVVVSAGLLFDLVVYTMWLKRRTPLSVVFGGVSGGMPALAGRTLALGGFDVVGLLLAAGVVLWIPSHILTLSSHYANDYARAGVPTWGGVFGERSARRVVAVATLLASVTLTAAGIIEGIAPAALAGLVVAGGAIDVVAIVTFARPSDRSNWILFKAASVYMLTAFVCLTFGGAF